MRRAPRAELVAPRRVERERDDRAGHRVDVVGGNGDAVLLVAQVIRHAARRCRDHGQPTRHRLEHDEAECLRERREEKCVSARVQSGQRPLSIEHAEEQDVGSGERP